MERVERVAAVERGELLQHRLGRGRTGTIGRGLPLLPFPDLLPDLLHNSFDVNLRTLRYILHMFSLTCSLAAPHRGTDSNGVITQRCGIRHTPTSRSSDFTAKEYS